MNMIRIGAALGTAMLSGCVTGDLANVRSNALDPVAVSATIAEVKRQILVYQTYVKYMRDDPSKDLAFVEARAKGFECAASIDFDVFSVMFDLTTTTVSTVGGAAGATIPPVVPGALGGGVKATGSISSENAQQLTFFAYPTNVPIIVDVLPPLDEAPIASAILGLRRSMLLAATEDGACMTNFNPTPKAANTASDPDPSYKMALKITKVGGVEGGITLGIINVGASATNNSATGNAITVKFRQIKKGEGGGGGFFRASNLM